VDSRRKKEGAKFETSASSSPGAPGKMVNATANADEGIWSADQVQGPYHEFRPGAELVSRIKRDANPSSSSRLGRHDVGAQRKPPNNSVPSLQAREAIGTLGR
jgi:hypothetical protein